MSFLPVTPTITSGCAAKREKTTEPSTEANRTSLTPKLIAVFANMSKEKARAGRILDGKSVVSSSSPHVEYHKRGFWIFISLTRQKKKQGVHDQSTSKHVAHQKDPKKERKTFIFSKCTRESILCKIHIHRRRHHPIIPRILPIAPIKGRPPSHIPDHASEQSNPPPLLLCCCHRHRRCPRSLRRCARHFSRQRLLAFVPEMGLGAQRVHAALPWSLFPPAVVVVVVCGRVWR